MCAEIGKRYKKDAPVVGGCQERRIRTTVQRSSVELTKERPMKCDKYICTPGNDSGRGPRYRWKDRFGNDGADRCGVDYPFGPEFEWIAAGDV